MEYASYSPSSILQLGRFLHCEEEEYAAYSIARRRREVYVLLLLSSLHSSTRCTPCPLAHTQGQGVYHLLHHKEERMRMLRTPSCASFHPCDGASLSSITRVGYILHHNFLKPWTIFKPISFRVNCLIFFITTKGLVTENSTSIVHVYQWYWTNFTPWNVYQSDQLASNFDIGQNQPFHLIVWHANEFPQTFVLEYWWALQPAFERTTKDILHIWS